VDCREFTLAEIEHYTLDKHQHPKFHRVQSVSLPLLVPSQEDRGIQCVQVADALDKGIIDNQTIAYFMARTLQFLQSIGIHQYVRNEKGLNSRVECQL